MAQEAAKTGAGPTALVAIEQFFPEKERIIEDDLAYRMLSFGARVFLWLVRPHSVRDWMVRATENDAPGIWSGMMCRKRYIDEKLTDAINQHQIAAVVNLGAGFDTRAYRLPALSDIPVWELDQLGNIKSKQIRLRKVFGTIPSHIQLVGIDFDHEDLRAVLESHSYTMDKRTFFIWEGVTQYLTEKGVRTTFDFLSKVARGSRLAFTYVRKDFLEGRAMYNSEKLYKRYVTNKNWIFGMEPERWTNFLKEYGWQVIEDVGYDEMAEKYVKPTGRRLASTPIERMIYAEKL
ncbi:SAM-dependent methyltransferase [Alicyclobacillus contaminans]|uniref:SAM-dependent methyltransferase n=1 Tax=Alicyclobacillus contaminans TaxID=392016 RepID=UPI0003F664C6|nr:SAM-dependent methyltransferase [Alicyclobacillus contaminans]GMA48969.1 SAM-dependent methyltransferase [Alicyclobacillus contaminans]